MNFGTNLRNIRVQRGLTQQQLANDLEISQASVTAYEVGIREPSFDMVRRFAEYFHVPASSLTPFSDENIDDSITTIAENIHANEKLRILFDTVKDFGPGKLDTMITMANALSEANRP